MKPRPDSGDHDFFKVGPQLWLNPTPGHDDLNKLESTLPNITSTQISAFLAEWHEKGFLKNTNELLIIQNYVLCKDCVVFYLIKLEFSLPNNPSA